MKSRVERVMVSVLAAVLCFVFCISAVGAEEVQPGEGDDLQGGNVSVVQLTEVAGLVLKNTSYADVFKKISDPINVYAGIMGDFQKEKFNEELMLKIDAIQGSLVDIENQIASEDRELQSAIKALEGKVDMQSYSQMMSEVKTIDNQVNLLYTDYKEILDSADESTPEQNKEHAQKWANRAEGADLDGKISRINALMSDDQGTDTLLAAGERVLRNGYPFEHQIHDPVYAMYQYTVGVRQRLLFLDSEYYHYQSALKNDPLYNKQYLTRYNVVATAINTEVEHSQITELADPEGVKQSLALHNPDRGSGKTVEGYGVILNANKKEYFIAQGADTLSTLFTCTHRKTDGRYPYEDTFIHSADYPAEDTTGQFKLIDSQGDLRPLAEAAWNQDGGERFLDWLVTSGGLTELGNCKALLTSDYVENLPGPLLYTNTTTRDGRQNLFDANAITYNDLDKSVITQGYIANSLRVSAGYHFGGEATETPWYSAPLLIVLENGGDGPVKDNTFVPRGIEDFPGTDPVLGLSFGHTLTVDLSQMTQTDFQGKTLHLEGKVILDGGDSQKSFKGLSLEMGKGAEVILKNVDITGRDNTPVLKATGGTSTLSITGRVTLTGGGGTQNRPGILVNGNDTLTIQSGTADGSPGQLTVKAAGGAPGIDNGYSNLKITGVTLSAAGSGDYAGIQPGHHLEMEDSAVTAQAGSAKAADIGDNYFTKERSRQANHQISNCTLTLGYNQISGNIQMMPDCQYTKGVPYYITFTHGNVSEDWDDGSEYVRPLTLTITGSGGERSLEADCSIASVTDPEVMVLEDGDLSAVNLGSLETLEIETFTDGYGPYPQTLRVAMGSPYGAGEELCRFDCYRELSASEVEDNTFHIDDRVSRLSLRGGFTPQVLSQMRVALTGGGTGARLGGDIPWMGLSECYQNERGDYYLNLGNDLEAAEILWLRRQDGDKSNAAKLTFYYVIPLKESIGGVPQKGVSRDMVQWLPLKGVGYPIFLKAEPVNSFEVTLALQNQRVLADDLLLEVEGTEGTQRIALKKFLPEGTWLSATPTQFNVLFDQGMGNLKRARLIQGDGTAKNVSLSIAQWDFYVNQTGHSSDYPTTFSLGPCVMHPDEWHTFKAFNLGGVEEKPKPEVPATPGGSNPLDTGSKLEAQNPGTGWMPAPKGTAEIYGAVLAVLGTVLLFGWWFSKKKSCRR